MKGLVTAVVLTALLGVLVADVVDGQRKEENGAVPSKPPDITRMVDKHGMTIPEHNVGRIRRRRFIGLIAKAVGLGARLIGRVVARGGSRLVGRALRHGRRLLRRGGHRRMSRWRRRFQSLRRGRSRLSRWRRRFQSLRRGRSRLSRWRRRFKSLRKARRRLSRWRRRFRTLRKARRRLSRRRPSRRRPQPDQHGQDGRHEIHKWIQRIQSHVKNIHSAVQAIKSIHATTMAHV